MKLRSITGALGAIVAISAAGQAAAQAPVQPVETERDCFYSRSINGFSAVDDETVNLRVGVSEVYQIKLFAPSSDIEWASGIAMIARGGNFICSGLDATVVVPGPAGPQRYPVTSIRRLTAEETAALPRDQRP
jgi:hypothetical protein